MIHTVLMYVVMYVVILYITYIVYTVHTGLLIFVFLMLGSSYYYLRLS